MLLNLIVSFPAVDNAKCLPFSCVFLDQGTRDCSCTILIVFESVSLRVGFMLLQCGVQFVALILLCCIIRLLLCCDTVVMC